MEGPSNGGMSRRSFMDVAEVDYGGDMTRPLPQATPYARTGVPGDRAGPGYGGAWTRWADPAPVRPNNPPTSGRIGGRMEYDQLGYQSGSYWRRMDDQGGDVVYWTGGEQGGTRFQAMQPPAMQRGHGFQSMQPSGVQGGYGYEAVPPFRWAQDNVFQPVQPPVMQRGHGFQSGVQGGYGYEAVPPFRWPRDNVFPSMQPSGVPRGNGSRPIGQFDGPRGYGLQRTAPREEQGGSGFQGMNRGRRWNDLQGVPQRLGRRSSEGVEQIGALQESSHQAMGQFADPAESAPRRLERCGATTSQERQGVQIDKESSSSIQKERDPDAPVQCMFESFGCQAKFRGESLRLHEYDCSARPLPCVYNDCGLYLSTASSIADHLVIQHGEPPAQNVSEVQFHIDLTKPDFKMGQIVRVYSNVFFVFCLRHNDAMACQVLMFGNRQSSNLFRTKICFHGLEGAKPFTRLGPVRSLLDKDLTYESAKYTCEVEVERLMRVAIQDENGGIYALVNIEIQPVFPRQ